MILSAACQTFDAVGGSLLAANIEQAQLSLLYANGFRNDPLLVALQGNNSQLLQLLESAGNQILITRKNNLDLHEALTSRNPGIESAVLVPLVLDHQVKGIFTIYLDEEFELTRKKDELKILMVMAYQAAVGADDFGIAASLSAQNLQIESLILFSY